MIKNMWREDSGDYQASPWYQSNWSGGAPRRTAPVMGGNDKWGQPAEIDPGFNIGGPRRNPWQGKLPGTAPVQDDGIAYAGGTKGFYDRPNPLEGVNVGGRTTAMNSDMVPGARPNPNVGINPPKIGEQAPSVLSPEMEELRRRRGVTQGFQQFRNTDNDYRRNQTQYLQKPFQQLTLEEMQQRPMHGGWQAQGGPATSRGSPFKANYENYRTY